MKKDKILKNKHDLYPLFVTTTGVLLSFLLLIQDFDDQMTAIIFALSLLMRHLIPLHQHHHAHCSIFNNRFLNFIYDQILMIGGGNSTPVWFLHHCVDHHQNFLHPHKDVEGQYRFGKEIPLRRLVFTVLGFSRTTYDSYIILNKLKGRNQKKLRRSLNKAFFVEVFIYAILLYLFPLKTLYFIILPNIYLKLLVFWVNYAQHNPEETSSIQSNSNTDLRFGYLFLNLGHHAAHHEMPTLHWSKLSKRTSQILT